MILMLDLQNIANLPPGLTVTLFIIEFWVIFVHTFGRNGLIVCGGCIFRQKQWLI